MNTFYLLIIAILIILLIYSFHRNLAVQNEKEQLVKVREAALDIANKVLDSDTLTDLYQDILESCLELIPTAKFG
ncbi:MAG: hypothetical protein AAGU14_10850, partial [Eubacteriaceae bacterium]